MYRMRVRDMRVLYTIDDVVYVISIENIDNRGDVYKRLQKIKRAVNNSGFIDFLYELLYIYLTRGCLYDFV